MADQETQEQAPLSQRALLNKVRSDGETPSPEAEALERGNIVRDGGAPAGDVYGLDRVEQEQR